MAADQGASGDNVWRIESVVDGSSGGRGRDGPEWHQVVGRLFGKWGLRAGGDCEEHYGILPCSTSLGGNAALLVTYGYMLLQAAQLLSDGSELLLTVMSPGIIGGLVLPVLGAFPDALLIAGKPPPPTLAHTRPQGCGDAGGRVGFETSLGLFVVDWDCLGFLCVFPREGGGEERERGREGTADWSHPPRLLRVECCIGGVEGPLQVVLTVFPELVRSFRGPQLTIRAYFLYSWKLST